MLRCAEYLLHDHSRGVGIRLWRLEILSFIQDASLTTHYIPRYLQYQDSHTRRSHLYVPYRADCKGTTHTIEPRPVPSNSIHSTIRLHRLPTPPESTIKIPPILRLKFHGTVLDFSYVQHTPNTWPVLAVPEYYPCYIYTYLYPSE
jgi:hypothetical protein